MIMNGQVEINVDTKKLRYEGNLYAVLSVEGSVAGQGAARVSRRLEQMCEENDFVALDMSKISQVASLFVGVIAKYTALNEVKGRGFRCIHPNSLVYDLLNISFGGKSPAILSDKLEYE